MEILQLKYFCDAAQTQNFSKTAKFLNISLNYTLFVKIAHHRMNCFVPKHTDHPIATGENFS